MATLSARSRQGDRGPRAVFVTVLLVFLLAVALVHAISVGATGTSFLQVGGATLAGLLGMTDAMEITARERLIIYEIRMPRAILAMAVGAALAVSGAIMQGLFRNPLADPGLVGVSAGAGLAAAVFIVLGGTWFAGLGAWAAVYGLPLFAFTGGLITTSVLYGVATRNGRTSVATMLLAGIALGAAAGAATGLLVFVSDDRQLRDLTFWSLGSLGGASWSKVSATLPFICIVLLVMPFLGKALNALALGEAEALHLGIAVQRMKRIAIITVALAVGAAVAAAGVIGFVGIVVPHLLRLLIGPDNRQLLPASALLGATLLLVADSISRTVVAPAELPIGIVTAIIGVPIFLWILLRKRGVLDL